VPFYLVKIHVRRISKRSHLLPHLIKMLLQYFMRCRSLWLTGQRLQCSGWLQTAESPLTPRVWTVGHRCVHAVRSARQLPRAAGRAMWPRRARQTGTRGSVAGRPFTGQRGALGKVATAQRRGRFLMGNGMGRCTLPVRHGQRDEMSNRNIAGKAGSKGGNDN